eukprot:Em0021g686a
MFLFIVLDGLETADALSILEPLLSDPVPFVQQAALVASAMVLIQQTETMCPKGTFFRQHYAKIISDKHEDLLAKFGSILAQGIIDAVLTLRSLIPHQSRTGHTHMKTVVGLLVFSQFWFWYPLCHFLSLAFTPAALIALNADLKMPKMEFCSNAKPSMYGYPAPLEKEKEKEREKVATAVLSVVAKANTKRKLKAGANKAAEHSEESKDEPSGDKMDTLEPQKDGDNKMDTSDAAKRDDKEDDSDIKLQQQSSQRSRKMAKRRLWNQSLSSLCFQIQLEFFQHNRAMLGEAKVSALWRDCALLLCRVSVGGIIMFKHLDDSQPEELMEPVKALCAPIQRCLWNGSYYSIGESFNHTLHHLNETIVCEECICQEAAALATDDSGRVIPEGETYNPIIPGVGLIRCITCTCVAVAGRGYVSRCMKQPCPPPVPCGPNPPIENYVPCCPACVPGEKSSEVLGGMVGAGKVGLNSTPTPSSITLASCTPNPALTQNVYVNSTGNSVAIESTPNVQCFTVRVDTQSELHCNNNEHAAIL